MKHAGSGRSTWIVGTLVAALSLSAHAVFMSDGLVAYYPFNGNATDESGNGNHGTVFGAQLTVDRFGNSASSYSFDGISDFIQIQDSPSLNPASAITVSAWIHSTEARVNSGIVGKWGADDQAVGQWALWAGNLQGPQGAFNQGFSAMTVGTGLPHPQGGGLRVDHIVPQVDGIWHHLLMTYDGSALELYKDGTPLGSELGGIGTLAVYAQAVEIGRYYHGANRDGQSYYFAGQIDEVRIYDRALSATEVAGLYNYERTNAVPESEDIGLAAVGTVILIFILDKRQRARS